MITNPSTLGLFEQQIGEIAELVHAVGGLVYLDGANMNAILGITRPGDFGADMMHFNPHKTFSGPHGGGGPGAGPICVSEKLEPFLPSPVVGKQEHSDGTRRRPSSWTTTDRNPLGECAVSLETRVYSSEPTRTYPRTVQDGLRRVSENAVLNANYLLSLLKDVLPVPHGDRCMHEFVASAKPLKKQCNLSAMDIAKRLLDYGFHAPTVYFPLTVPEAVMIEPTETESKETLDAFAKVIRLVIEEADLATSAPHSTIINRPDEVRAARQPQLVYSSDDK